MLSILRRSIRLAAQFTLCMSAVPATISHAGAVTVENYSNNPIAVAIAFQRGQEVSDGWFTIQPNGRQTFNLPNDRDAYLRVEEAGREKTFQNHQFFDSFPTIRSRFSVKNEPDDPTVRTLRWGANLEFQHNMRRDQGMPPGWMYQRYFHVGTENRTLEVRPD